MPGTLYPGQGYPGLYYPPTDAPVDHQIEPAKFTNASAFYTAAVNGQISPAKLINTSAFYQLALNGQIAPVNFSNVSSFYQPRVAFALRPAHFVNVSIFPQPAISAELPPAFDGSGLIIIRKGKKRRHTPAHARQRTPEDIRREQHETERYLEELGERAKRTVEEKERARSAPVEAPEPVEPALTDAIARAAAAEQFMEGVRAQAAELARQKAAEGRRRTALLLLALD